MTATPPPDEMTPQSRPRRQSWVSRHAAAAVVIAALASLGIGLVAGWALFNDADEVDALNEENDALTAEVESLQQQVDDLESDAESGASELRDEIARLESENRALQNQITRGLAKLEASVSYVADVVGLDADEVTTEASAAEWIVTRYPLLNTGKPAGTIILQSPAVGTPMVAGSAFVLWVASELADVGVDQAGDYIGQQANDVAAEAAGYGWVVSFQTREDDDTPVGTIVAQNPKAGTPMTQGSSLVLTVAIATPTTTTTTAPPTTAPPTTG